MAIPYRDFPPYKGVLGYYFLSPAMFFSHSLLTPLFYIKGQIALVNTACIALSAIWAARYFDKRAVILALLIVMANQHFILNSADLRVDMLATWLCLFSALAILGNRYFLSGVLMGFAFLVSQKALWYFTAIDCSLILCWMTIPKTRFNFRPVLWFNVATIIPVAIYFIFWASISSSVIVYQSLFYEAYIQSAIDWYMVVYLLCWQIAISNGPLPFLAWPLAFIPLFTSETHREMLELRLFAFAFASITLLQFVHYKQPFPYNFVFTMPAFFLLFSSLLTWLVKKHTATERFAMHVQMQGLLQKSGLVLALLYSIGTFVFIFLFDAPAVYYFCAILPLALFFYFRLPYQQWPFYLILAVFIISGILSPLYFTLIDSKQFNGNYQRTMIILTEELTGKGSDYVAGSPLLYQRDQPIDGLKNLIGPQIDYLYQATERTGKLLLPSLYLAQTDVNEVIRDFEMFPVKVVVNNYRIMSLPPKLTKYIADHYQHFYGSLYLYAPKIHPMQLTFYLKFTGNYQVETESKLPLMIDHKRVAAGETIKLLKGDHLSTAKSAYRLMLVPDVKTPLDKKFKEDFVTKAILT